MREVMPLLLASLWLCNAPALLRAQNAVNSGERLATADSLTVCSGSNRLGDADAARTRGGVIEGRVIDEQLRPVADARVSAQRVRGAGLQLQLWPSDSEPLSPAGGASGPTVVTDRLGVYRISGLSPGPYYVSALAPRPRKAAAAERTHPAEKVGYGATFYPGSTTAAYASPVRLRSGEQITGIDIRLESRKLARLSGRVLGTRGRLDNEGASIRLSPATLLGAGRVDAFSGHSSLSADGTFSIDDVPPGDYVLVARSVSPATIREVARTGRSEVLTRDPDSEFATLKVSVNGEDQTELQLQLSAGGHIAGRVSLDGRPFQPGGRFIPVVAEPLDLNATMVGATEVAIGPDGTFEIRSVTGEFLLRVGDLTPELALSRINLFGRDVADAGIFVSPREVVSDVEIVLTSSPTEVTGRIDKPTANVPQRGSCTVVVFSADASRWSLPSSRYVAAQTPQAGGVFSIVGLPPGTYLAFAVSEIDNLDAIDPEYLRQVARLGREVRLREGETAAVTLPLH